MWLVECSRFPPTTFVILTNQKCQLYLYAEDTSVYINELGGFVKTEMPFQTVLGFAVLFPVS